MTINRDQHVHELAYRDKQLLTQLGNLKVLLLGAGAVGSNVGLALARLGTGEITVCDYDRVELRNLGTQVYGVPHLGTFKANALSNLLMDVSDGNHQPYIKKIETVQALKKVAGDCDLLLDCFDNAKARNLAAQYAKTSRTPCLHVGFDGGYCSVRWQGTWTESQGEDNCDYPLSLSLCYLATAVVVETVFSFLRGPQRSWDITLADLTVRELTGLTK